MNQGDDIELTTTLLGLYECAVTPEKYPDLAEHLEACLAGEPDASVLDRLENHSGTIWEKAVDLFLAAEKDATEAGRVLEIPLAATGARPAALEGLLDRLRADDAIRFRALLDAPALGADGAGADDLLLRAAAGGDGAEEIYLARREGGAIRVFRLRSELAPEVEALMISQFGITHSELQILRGLALGKTFKEIARDGGKSIETIRSQAKSTAAKMGLSRQTEISATLASLSRIASSHGQPGASGLSRLRLSDGRSIAYDLAGDSSGEPVLFVHDFSSSCRWPRSVIAQIARANIHLLSPSRAGYGHSSVNKSTQLTLHRQHVRDYLRVADHLGLDRFRILAVGTGFGIAYALAAAEPGRVEGLVGLNVYPPILTRRDALHFPPGMYRAGALAALYAPRTCALITKYATKRASSARSIAELDRMTGSRGPWDSRDERFFQEFVRPNVADMLMPGAEGVWRDCTCLTIDWTLLGAQARRPDKAIILHNADFPYQPAAPVAALADRLGLPFQTLPRPYRHFLDDFSDVLSHLRRPGTLAAPAAAIETALGDPPAQSL